MTAITTVLQISGNYQPTHEEAANSEDIDSKVRRTIDKLSIYISYPFTWKQIEHLIHLPVPKLK